jgi:hypothetical protein
MAIKKWTVEAGRQIYYGGLPFISIGREGNTSPTDADKVTHLIARLFTEEGLTVDNEKSHDERISEMQRLTKIMKSNFKKRAQ